MRGRGPKRRRPFATDLLLMSINAVEADLRLTKEMSNALSDDKGENQQSD